MNKALKRIELVSDNFLKLNENERNTVIIKLEQLADEIKKSIRNSEYTYEIENKGFVLSFEEKKLGNEYLKVKVKIRIKGEKEYEKRDETEYEIKRIKLLEIPNLSDRINLDRDSFGSDLLHHFEYNAEAALESLDTKQYKEVMNYAKKKNMFGMRTGTSAYLYFKKRINFDFYFAEMFNNNKHSYLRKHKDEWFILDYKYINNINNISKYKRIETEKLTNTFIFNEMSRKEFKQKYLN